jgi:hypothetical protein
MITVAQISQMVMGVAIAGYYIISLRSGAECAVDKELLMSCGIMYSTYLYLFGAFFVKRFIFGPTKAKKQV